MILTLFVALGLFLSLIIYLMTVSPGNPQSYKDASGNTLKESISEKIFVSIGGTKQGMIIRSKNVNNPVLLYVHGGPGFPVYYLFEQINPGLEELFTVCYWEQRGGGLSFTKDVKIETMNLDQLKSDAIEVTNYLRQRFGKEKIYILGHSGGTAIALPAVSSAPGLYHAYIAMAQLTRQYESERIAYDYMLKQFLEKNDKPSIKALKKYRNLETDYDLLSFYNSGFRDEAMHKLGIGTMRDMRSIITGIFLPSWTCRAYTLREKYILWKSKFFFLPKTNLRRETLWTDFPAKYQVIDIPLYFTCGKYDLTVNIDLTRDYFDQVHAPLKRFYTFVNSSHSPLLEEPEKFMEILKKDILQSTAIPANQKEP